MSLGETVKELFRKPAVKLGSLALGASMFLSPLAKAQDVNTSDSLIWKKQAVEQTVLNAHDNIPLPSVKTTYTLLDTLIPPPRFTSLINENFLTNNQGVAKDSVWTTIINPHYNPATGMSTFLDNILSEELKLFFDGSQYKFEGTTKIEPELLNIFSITGQKVFSDEINNYNPGSLHSEASFSLDNLSPGMYVLNLNNDPSYSLKFVKSQNDLAPLGVTKDVAPQNSSNSLKSASVDTPLELRYERLFENTSGITSFPSFKDTIAINTQQDPFTTTTLISQVNYLYQLYMRGTPGSLIDVSVEGNTFTDFSFIMPEDSLFKTSKFKNIDSEILLHTKASKRGYDSDSASWVMSVGEIPMFDLYLNKSLLPHSLSGQAHKGTQLFFTLPDTTLSAIADEHNLYQTDIIWRVDSTFTDVRGRASLDPYPAIIDTFDLEFGNVVRDYLVDTTMNGFNFVFKGFPSTELDVRETTSGEVLFNGEIAQDSLAYVFGPRSLDELITVTVSATLPWHADSIFSIVDALPGTTFKDIFLKNKFYDFTAKLTTHPETKVTGSFGGQDIGTLYADMSGNVTLPSQQFIQPDSLQEVNVNLEKDLFETTSVSFIAKPGDNSFASYPDSLYNYFDVKIKTWPGVMATGFIGYQDIDTVYSNSQGNLFIPQKKFAQPTTSQEVNLKLEKEFLADKHVSFTAEKGTTSLTAYLDNLYYTFDVRLQSQPNVKVMGDEANDLFPGPLYTNDDGLLWLPQITSIQPDSIHEYRKLSLSKQDHYSDFITFYVKPDTTFYEHFLTPYRFADVTGTVTREDGLAMDDMQVILRNISNPAESYTLLSADSVFAFEHLFLPKEGVSSPYELNVSLVNYSPDEGPYPYIDTLFFDEGANSVNCVLPLDAPVVVTDTLQNGSDTTLNNIAFTHLMYSPVSRTNNLVKQADSYEYSSSSPLTDTPTPVHRVLANNLFIDTKNTPYYENSTFDIFNLKDDLSE